MEEKIIAFLNYYSKEENIKIELDKDLEHSDMVKYDLILPNIIRYKYVDNFNRLVDQEEKVSRWLARKLRFQYDKNVELLRSTFINSPVELTSRQYYLVCNRLQVFLEEQDEAIEKYPILLLPIRGLVDKINREFRVPNWNDFKLNESILSISEDKVKDIDVGQFERTPDSLIDEVFSFFQGKNQEGQTILAPDDYILLKEYLNELVTNNNLPRITKRISPKLPKGIISFSVWVLHKELYPSYFKVSTIYLEFLQKVFDIYKDTEVSSIKSQFGVRSRVPKHHYLPEIINNYLL